MTCLLFLTKSPISCVRQEVCCILVLDVFFQSLLELDRRIEEAQQRNDREVARLSRDREVRELLEPMTHGIFYRLQAMKRRAHVAEERVKHVEKELRTVLNE